MIRRKTSPLPEYKAAVVDPLPCRNMERMGTLRHTATERLEVRALAYGDVDSLELNALLRWALFQAVNTYNERHQGHFIYPEVVWSGSEKHEITRRRKKSV